MTDQHEAAEAKLAEVEALAKDQQAWIDTAVAACARRGCATKDARLAEAEAKLAAAEADGARLREALRFYARGEHKGGIVRTARHNYVEPCREDGEIARVALKEQP